VFVDVELLAVNEIKINVHKLRVSNPYN
jgi:hypothetical protein